MKIFWLYSGQGRIMQDMIRRGHNIIGSFSDTSEKNNTKLSDSILEQAKQADLICCTFNRLLEGRLLDEFRWRILNFHPALLPEFKGMNAIKRTLDSGCKYGGCTVHYVDKTMDGGEVVIQAKFPVEPKGTYGLRLFRIGCDIMDYAINHIAA